VANVSKVNVDNARLSNQLGNALNRLPQDIIG
jgi:hypothetical protein